jgi:2-isopropylmalate synthase
LSLNAEGAGPIEAAAKALSTHFDKQISVIDYHEHGLSEGADAEAVSYVEIQLDQEKSVFGVAKDNNIATAAIKALINGVNRHYSVINEVK